VKKLAIYTIIKPNPLDSHLSGGFAAMGSVIRAFEAIGYDPYIITPKDSWQEPDSFDCSLYADIFNDPEGSPWFSNEQYNTFINSKNYVILENGLTGCNPKPYGLGGKIDNGSYEENKLSFYMKHLMRGSLLNIFCSPAHLEEFSRFLHERPKNSYAFYQEIDTKIFNNLNQKRDIPYLYVGALNWFKGLDRAIEIFGNSGLKIIGRKTEAVKSIPSHIEYLGEKNAIELSQIYNKTINFVHLPRCQESFCRTVVEAALCGCNLITNENIGAFSFGYDIRDPNLGARCFYELKNQIKNILK
jgi:glycosyltransferase involved in cell wall biosynthesis